MSLLMVDDVKVSRRCVSHSLVPVLVGCSLWLQQASNGEISRMRYVIAESGRPANAFRHPSRVKPAARLDSLDRNHSCSPNVRAVRDVNCDSPSCSLAVDVTCRTARISWDGLRVSTARTSSTDHPGLRTSRRNCE